MRWFNAFFMCLNPIVLCSSLMYCNVIVCYLCILNNILVYVNIGMFVYNLYKYCIVYMNS